MSILETLDKDIVRKEHELNQLKAARKLLTIYENEPVTEEAKLAPLPAPVSTPAPPPTKQDQVFDPRPICTACDSRMMRLRKTVPSGLQIEYWHCTNSGCNNEMY